MDGLSDVQRGWVLDCGSRYWGSGRGALEDLLRDQFRARPSEPTSMPRPNGEAVTQTGHVAIALPDWASDLGVDRCLLVDCAAVAERVGAKTSTRGDLDWQDIDWLAAAFHHLTGSAERRHEAAFGPALSYALRLRGIDQKIYDHAWANRIFLFLRRWAAVHNETGEESIFGPLPDSEIVLTHDVDAIAKTPEIRLKQAAFHLFNSGRSIASGRFHQGTKSIGKAVRFGLSGGDFRTFEQVRRLETKAGLRSILHFYGGPPGLRRKTPSRILIDPAYDVTSPQMKSELRAFVDGGWTVGLHQSTHAWNAADAMRLERDRVAQSAGAPVTVCRQHWLRFSWKSTWRAQQDAGLTQDSTLGFNDRPGFRNGAALRFHPWDFNADSQMALEAIPMVFMDSHFYDYEQFRDDERAAAMARWLGEVRAVHGQASVNWHTHTITDAYGWGFGYEQLLALLAGRRSVGVT